jgi:hypothetical protein
MRNLGPSRLLALSAFLMGALVLGCITARGQMEPRGESTVTLGRSCQTDDWSGDCPTGCHLEQVGTCFCSAEAHRAGDCFDCPAPGYECVADIPTPEPDSGPATDAGALDADVTDASAPSAVDGSR